MKRSLPSRPTSRRAALRCGDAAAALGRHSAAGRSSAPKPPPLVLARPGCGPGRRVPRPSGTPPSDERGAVHQAERPPRSWSGRADGSRQRVVASPIARRRVVGQSLRERPALWSARAASARRSSFPLPTSSSTWRSHSAASNSANHPRKFANSLAERSRTRKVVRSQRIAFLPRPRPAAARAGAVIACRAGRAAKSGQWSVSRRSPAGAGTRCGREAESVHAGGAELVPGRRAPSRESLGVGQRPSTTAQRPVVHRQRNHGR